MKTIAIVGAVPTGIYTLFSLLQQQTPLSISIFEQADEAGVKWFTEFGHLNRGDMLTSEQHRCHNEKKKFQRRV